MTEDKTISFRLLMRDQIPEDCLAQRCKKEYLEPGNIEFDIVIIDEASQVRPEEAIGAIARGRQVVVVGDPLTAVS